MIALDKKGRPTTVPRLLCESEEDKRAFAEGERRYRLRKQIKQVEQ